VPVLLAGAGALGWLGGLTLMTVVGAGAGLTLMFVDS
jgi:hypothetical protein